MQRGKSFFRRFRQIREKLGDIDGPGKMAGEILAIIGKTYEDKPIEKKVGIDEAIRVAIEAVKILDKKL